MAFGGAAFGASSSSLFGSSFATPQPNLFGANPSAPFGQRPTQDANNLWSNSAPASSIPPQGTRTFPYQLSQINDNSSSEPGKYITISAMDPYRHFSVEELRIADYARGDKGSDQPPPATPFNSSFGQSVSTFAQASSSAFGFQQSTPAFGSAFGSSSSSAFGAPTSVFGASSSAFGASNTLGPSNPYGGGSNSAFAPATNTAFGAGSSTFGASANTAFGSVSAPAFGASAQSSSFGASQAPFGGGSFGASSSAFGGGMSSFGPPSSSASLFGASQGGSLFGSGQSQGALFGSSSSAAGASGTFGAPFGGSTPVQTSHSLFGGSGFGSFGASAASTGSGAFGNSGSSLFGTGSGIFASSSSIGGGGMFGASTGSSMFGSGFGGLGFSNSQSAAQQAQQTQGPLEASLTNNPFGDSKLFLGATANAPSAHNALGTSVVNTSKNPGQTQQKSVSVVVNPPSQAYRRTRGSDLLARQTFMQKNNSSTGWFAASPMRLWGESGPVFNVGSVLRTQRDRVGSGKTRGLAPYAYPWRTEEQVAKAANLKRLVIEPTPGETPLQGSSSELQTEGRQVSNGSGGGQPKDSTNDATTSAQKHRYTGFLLRQPLGSGVDGGLENGEGIQETPASSSPDQGNRADSGDPIDGASQRNSSREKRDGGAVRAGPDDEDEEGTANPLQVSPQNDASGDMVDRLTQFTPYSDFYRRQMSASRGRSSIGSGERRNSRRGPTDTPICTDPEYYTSPSLEELSKMSRDELSHVEEFTIGRKSKGEILWLEPVDLRGVNFDNVVQIKDREVSVYPQSDDVPPVGQGLNKPARVKLFGIHKFNKRTKEPLTDASTAAKMVQRLKAHCVKEGLEFLGYDIKTGTWIFKANNF